MPDEAGNLTAIEQSQNMTVMNSVMGNDEGNSADAVENLVDMHIWARDPDAHKIFAEINKDLGFGILKPVQLKQLQDYLGLFALYSHIEGEYALQPDSDAKFFLRKAYVLCTTSRSLDGKGLLTLGEQTRNVQIASNIPGLAPGQQQQSKLGWLNPFKGR